MASDAFPAFRGLAIVLASEDPRTAHVRLADMIPVPFAVCRASAMQQWSNIRLRMGLRMGRDRNADGTVAQADLDLGTS
jgi:hypothetical protein